MSKCLKRYRQIDLFESFRNCKREKRSAESLMDSGLESLSENTLSKDGMTTFDSICSAAEEVLAAAAKKQTLSQKNVSEDEISCVEETSCSSYGTSSETTLLESYNSEDLFPGTSQSVTSEGKVESTSDVKQCYVLNKHPECSAPLPTLTPSSSHTILFRPHFRDGEAPRPYPDAYRDRWDADHVRMPCSPESRIPVQISPGEEVIQDRWQLIKKSLKRSITTSFQLEQAIMQYNSQYSGRWDFRGLHVFFNKALKPEQRDFFFQSTLPAMIDLALQVPQICTQPIPLLKKLKDHSLTLSQKQIGCLLANAFFCTFPRRNGISRRNRALKLSSEYGTYPDINFNRLFVRPRNGISDRYSEKLKCLINYFTRITSKEPSGAVTFHRQYLQQLPNWMASKQKIRNMAVRSDGVIETEGSGMLQVDFANRYVGGGVLGFGCVQEEIRFIICPELIVSRLFTECLANTEALIITGVERYNKYIGYADDFLWDGDFQDNTPRDTWGRRCTQVVAIDALHFSNSDDQYKLSLIKRELNKAYSGFFQPGTSSENLSAVATGNWGCGVYKGHPELKFLLQLMAASQAGRDILYFTFGNEKLQKEIEKIFQYIKKQKFTVGHIWDAIEDYCSHAVLMEKEIRPSLYEYIYGGTPSVDFLEPSPSPESNLSCDAVNVNEENSGCNIDSETDTEKTDID